MEMMDRRTLNPEKEMSVLFVHLKFVLIAVFFIQILSCSREVEMVPKTRFPEKIKIGGELEQRIDLTIRRLQSHPYNVNFVVQDVARIKGKKRRFEEYEGDVSGRTLGAWSYVSRLLGQHPAKLDSIANEILKYQKPEGYFGKNQMEEGFDYWGRQNFGHGRLLVGLVEYYRLTGNHNFLEAAEKLGDYFSKTIPLWTTKYPENPWTETSEMNWKDHTSNRLHFIKTHQTSVLEGLVMLYEVSHNPKYLKTAESVVRLFPEFGQYHSHSYLNSMVGIAKLYLKTGKASYKSLLLNRYWQDVMRAAYRPDGSVVEWFPIDVRTEGCSLTDFLRLNLHLWRITRESVYLDEAERIWLNGLNFHQTANGAFGHAHLTPTGYASPYSEAWWCCLMHGLFAYSEVVNYTLAVSENTLWVNFFTPIEGEILLNSGFVQVSLATGYPGKGIIELTLVPEKPFEFETKIRIPGWVTDFRVAVNGTPTAGKVENGFLSLSRLWQKGDQVSLSFPETLRLEDDRGNDLLKMRQPFREPVTAYFFHGPLLLAADLKQNTTFPELLSFNPAGNYRTEETGSNTFQITGTHYCIPARVSDKQGTALLVPLSEQTGYGKWTDELQNFVQNGEKPIQRISVQIQQKVKMRENY